MQKILASDAVIWLDEVQYSKGGFSNRNRTRQGNWFTVPVARGTDGGPLNRVRIAPHGPWRKKLSRTLRQEYGDCDLLEAVCEELQRPYGLLIALNLALLRIIFETIDARLRRQLYGRLRPPWYFQSHLDGGRTVLAVSEQREELLPISARLARMVAELGGDAYLSGPSGRHYLDEQPFRALGIEVRYWQHRGPNPCALELLASRVPVAA